MLCNLYQCSIHASFIACYLHSYLYYLIYKTRKCILQNIAPVIFHSFYISQIYFDYTFNLNCIIQINFLIMPLLELKFLYMSQEIYEILILLVFAANNPFLILINLFMNIAKI